MPEPTYRIKPLEWEQRGTTFRTENIAGRFWYWETLGEFWWHGPDGIYHRVDSLEAAKSAAEAHYRERLMQALEVVNG